ncbi:MAG: hypothetical protein OFPI_12240 [Osedax symbiont Rs2]|nr:MAG: hypothetical protein OFPI_12240 [Osedax symbiont Rs2]
MGPNKLIQSSKKPLYMFGILVSIFAAIGYTVCFAMGDENRSSGILIVQFSPLLAALITKLVLQKNLYGMGWRLGKIRYLSSAYVLAFFIAALSAVLVWVFGFADLLINPFAKEVKAGINQSFGLAISSDMVILLTLIVINGTIGLFIAFAAIGEELGWRGLLVPELYKHFSFTKTALISGIIWAIYHFPLVIGLVADRLEIIAWPMLVSLLIASIGLSVISAWYRLKSGSVWPVILFHAALNIHNQGFFQNITVKNSEISNYVSGEYGLMLAVVTSLVAVWFWRKRNELPCN